MPLELVGFAADAGKTQMKSDAAAEGGSAQPPQVGARSPRALISEFYLLVLDCSG